MTDMPTQSTLTAVIICLSVPDDWLKLKCRRKNSWQKTEPPNLNICYCYCDFAFQKMLFSMRNGIAQHIKHNQFLNLQSKSPRMVPTREWKPNLYPHYCTCFSKIQCTLQTLTDPQIVTFCSFCIIRIEFNHVQ